MSQHSTLGLEERRDFCVQALAAKEAFGALCARFGVSRVTGYRWVKHFREEGVKGCLARSSAPRSPARSRALQRWQSRLLELRRQRPKWGARKLLALLKKESPTGKLPSERSVERLLKTRGLARAGRQRSRPGPLVIVPRPRVAQKPNEVWTIDFKGWFKTGDGERCEPLTVRDLFSRTILCARALKETGEATVRAEMKRLFRRHGLPEWIHSDNGTPFATACVGAPLALTRLGAWWLRLGIEVEVGRRGCPQDNAAHEQMHRVLKAETASPAAATVRTQNRRMEKWRVDYNERRPHEAIGMRCPWELYEKSPRRYLAPKPIVYPPLWERRRVSAKGTIRLEGRARSVGRAFAGEWIGLRARSEGDATSGKIWDVFFMADHLIGELHRHDPGDIRAARRSQQRPADLSD